ncbi:MAG TPA: LuxR C-terminal-related transcriptional regulator [Ktedonobacteraceae bacterium]
MMADPEECQAGTDFPVPPADEGNRFCSWHNLPAQLTPLIGREHIVAEVCAFLKRADVRLTTLTGPGGIGKTRLSQQVAAQMSEQFVDGVYFVSLASLTNATLVPSTIARTLGLKLGLDGQRTAIVYLQFLKLFLQQKSFLLVLDNFEQVARAAPDLAELLAACPQLKILVTSRAALHIQGEYEVVVPPLSVPEREHIELLESAVLAQYPAVALFLQRALALKPGLALTLTNLQTIAAICLSLDGLPLAIELAAARIKLLPPQALRQRLTHPLEILTSNTRDAPARHQTLRDTIAWSYHLLEEAEQQLFRRLAVFVGGATLEAIEAICGSLPDQVQPVLDTVASLIDKSLLLQVERDEGEARIVMLETIREYALECLGTDDEQEMIRQRHAACYLALAEQGEQELRGPRQVSWLRRLEREYDNLRAILDWALRPDVPAPLQELHTETALRLAGTLRRFWQMHGHLHEGQTYLDRALAASEGVAVSSRAKAQALIAAGTLAATQNNFERVETFCRQSLALFRKLEDQPGIALSLFLLSVVPLMKNDSVGARSLTEEALALFRKMGDQERIAWSLSTLGLLDVREGKYMSAHALYEESLLIHRALGDKRGIARTLLQLASLLHISQGEQTAVHVLLEESLMHFQELGERVGIANAYTLLGQLAFNHNDPATARLWLEKSIKLYRETGHQKDLAESLALLARVFLALREYAQTRTLYEESLALARALNHSWLMASCLEGWAIMLADLHHLAWATQLWGAAHALREAISVPMTPAERADHERRLAVARARLGEELFSAAWAEGRAMTPEQALAIDRQAKVARANGSALSPSLADSAGLTARELEVLYLVASGLTNTQIAQQLVLSEKTVATHLTHIFNKTMSENRAGAVAFAIRHGLV